MTTEMLKIAPAAECITPWAPGDKALDYVKSLGCVYVQLDFTQFKSGMNFTVDEARSLADALGQRGLRGETMSAWPGDVIAEVYVDFLERIARAAPTLGLKVMNTYLLPFVRPDEGETIKAYKRGLADTLAIAADNGLTITVEPEAHDVSRNVAGLKRILVEVDHPALKINYDPCNLYHGGEEGFPYAYFELREQIAYIHLKNGSVFREGIDPDEEKGTPFASPREDRTIRWGPIDEGALNISRIVAQIIADGYDGVVALEPHAGGEETRRKFFAHEVAFLRSEMSRSAG